MLVCAESRFFQKRSRRRFNFRESLVEEIELGGDRCFAGQITRFHLNVCQAKLEVDLHDPVQVAYRHMYAQCVDIHANCTVVIHTNTNKHVELLDTANKTIETRRKQETPETSNRVTLSNGHLYINCGSQCAAFLVAKPHGGIVGAPEIQTHTRLIVFHLATAFDSPPAAYKTRAKKS